MKTLDGETIVWQGHPSWKAMIVFYVKWILISLIPIAIWVGIARRRSPHRGVVVLGGRA